MQVKGKKLRMTSTCLPLVYKLNREKVTKHSVTEDCSDLMLIIDTNQLESFSLALYETHLSKKRLATVNQVLHFQQVVMYCSLCLELDHQP